MSLSLIPTIVLIVFLLLVISVICIGFIWPTWYGVHSTSSKPKILTTTTGSFNKTTEEAPYKTIEEAPYISAASVTIPIVSELSNRVLKNRVEFYNTFEPYTIKWLESLEDYKCFYDIGSNVGGFAFIASKLYPNTQIMSFEPNIANFYVQRLTTIHNKIENITTINMPLSDKVAFDSFLYETNAETVGHSGTFGFELEKDMKLSKYGNPHKGSIHGTLRTFSVSLDFCVYNMNFPVPNYIKLDVDGNELLIFRGAKRLLKEPQLTKMIVEIDGGMPCNSEVFEIIESSGFIKVAEHPGLMKNSKMVVNEYERLG